MTLAPTCAEVKKKLIAEEGGASNVHGHTSWITLGIRIQELQYVHMRIQLVISSNVTTE